MDPLVYRQQSPDCAADFEWFPLVRTKNTSCPPPLPRCSHAATLVGSLLFITGGAYVLPGPSAGEDTINFTHINNVDIFDLRNTQWYALKTKNQEIFTCRRGHSAVMHEDCRRLVVFGGAGPNGALHNDVLVLDLAAGAWERPACGGTPPSPRRGHLCCVHGGKMFVFGGFREHTPIVLVPALLHILDLRTWRWEQPRPLRCACCRGGPGEEEEGRPPPRHLPLPIPISGAESCVLLEGGRLLFLGHYHQLDANFQTGEQEEGLTLVVVDLARGEVRGLPVRPGGGGGGAGGAASTRPAAEAQPAVEDFMFYSMVETRNNLIVLKPNRESDEDFVTNNKIGARECSELVQIDISDLDKTRLVYCMTVEQAKNSPSARNAASFTKVEENTFVLFGGGIFPNVYHNSIHVLEVQGGAYSNVEEQDDLPSYSNKQDSAISHCAPKQDNCNDEQADDEIVWLSIGERQIPGNRLKLSSCSPVWAALLSGRFREGRRRRRRPDPPPSEEEGEEEKGARQRRLGGGGVGVGAGPAGPPSPPPPPVPMDGCGLSAALLEKAINFDELDSELNSMLQPKTAKHLPADQELVDDTSMSKLPPSQKEDILKSSSLQTTRRKGMDAEEETSIQEALQLLGFADMYAMEELRSLCGAHLARRHLGAGSLAALWAAALDLNCPGLRRACRRRLLGRGGAPEHALRPLGSAGFRLWSTGGESADLKEALEEESYNNSDGGMDNKVGECCRGRGILGDYLGENNGPSDVEHRHCLDKNISCENAKEEENNVVAQSSLQQQEPKTPPKKAEEDQKPAYRTKKDLPPFLDPVSFLSQCLIGFDELAVHQAAALIDELWSIIPQERGEGCHNFTMNDILGLSDGEFKKC